jgi:hypothetical protein
VAEMNTQDVKEIKEKLDRIIDLMEFKSVLSKRLGVKITHIPSATLVKCATQSTSQANYNEAKRELAHKMRMPVSHIDITELSVETFHIDES